MSIVNFLDNPLFWGLDNTFQIGYQKDLELSIEKIFSASLIKHIQCDSLDTFSASNSEYNAGYRMGIAITSFKIEKHINLPLKVTLKVVDKMKDVWITKCHCKNPNWHGPINGFDFYLDSYCANPQFFASTASGWGGEKSSKEIRENWEIFYTTREPNGTGHVTATTFNFLIG